MPENVRHVRGSLHGCKEGYEGRAAREQRSIPPVFSTAQTLVGEVRDDLVQKSTDTLRWSFYHLELGSRFWDLISACR